MKIIKKIIDEKLNIPKSLTHFIGEGNFCFIDIETLGLNRKFHSIALIGYLYEENNKIIIKQLLAEGIEDESLLLKTFLEDLKGISTIITYNGRAFDIPFIKARAAELSLNCNMDNFFHIDLLLYVKKYHRYFSLDNYKLKTVEGFLGLIRQDTISGRDSVQLYREYLKTKSSDLEEKILLHNFEDIFHLPKLLKIFDFLPLKDHTFKSTIHLLEDHPPLDFYYNPYEFTITEAKLKLQGKVQKLESIKEELHYQPSFFFRWIPLKGYFEFEVTLKVGTLPSKKKYYYIDLYDFSIEPEEFKAMVSDSSAIHQHYLIIDCDFPASVLALLEFKKLLMLQLFKW